MAGRESGPRVKVRHLVVSWVAGLVMLMAAGSSLSVAVLNSPLVGSGEPSGFVWTPVMLAPVLAGAASVLVLRVPGTEPGDWLQAAVPMPALAATYALMLGFQAQGLSPVLGIFMIVATAVVLGAAVGAVLCGWLKQRVGRRRSQG